VLLSFYRFFEGWFFEPDSIDLDAFAEHLFFKGSGSGLYWNHINEWWTVRDRENVLFLCYENIIKDPSNLIKSVARFMELDLDDQLLGITLEHSSVDFMRKHASQFDDHPIKQARDSACGLPEGGESSKISFSENSQQKIVVSANVREKLSLAWQQLVTDKSGLENYQALLKQNALDC
jgi:hypothetical protein